MICCGFRITRSHPFFLILPLLISNDHVGCDPNLILELSSDSKANGAIFVKLSALCRINMLGFILHFIVL